MRGGCVYLAMAFAAAGLQSGAAGAQTPEVPVERLMPYTVKVPVNEVSVPFHAADFNGVPIRDITLSDLRILDNGKKPKEIVSFEAYKDLPIRVGFLMDASPSARGDLSRDEAIAREYVGSFFDAQRDQGFVMRFDGSTSVEQGWTGDKDVLTKGIHKVRTDRAYGGVGTAIFDALYKACRDQFATVGLRTGNFILLFTDGEDNASHVYLREAVEKCQETNTVVYVISDMEKAVFRKGDGQKTLTELAALTGGRVFFDQDQAAVRNDLRSIDANLRAQYRVVYKPEKLKADGSFHHIKLDSPKRGGDIVARTGYYAPH
jgi:Ca-activated chloride channel homolog